MKYTCIIYMSSVSVLQYNSFIAYAVHVNVLIFYRYIIWLHKFARMHIIVNVSMYINETHAVIVVRILNSML